MLDPHNEIDYGTPRRLSELEVTLEIDGNQVTVPKGTSLMRAAADAGIQVPKLCATMCMRLRVGESIAASRTRSNASRDHIALSRS